LSENSPSPQPPNNLKTKVLFALGLILMFVAVIGIFSALQSLVWQLQTRLRYTEGRAVVVSAKIVPQGTHSHELHIEHSVEIDGRWYRPTRNTEQHNPSYGNLADAEEALDYFGVGSVHPCWYDPADPDKHSVLIRHSMDLAGQPRVFGFSLLMGIIGWKLATRGFRSPASTK